MTRVAISLREKYGEDGMRFLQTFNPTLQIVAARSEDQAHTGDAPTLAQTRNAFGRNVAEIWVSVQLNDFSEFAGVREKINPRQMDEVAAMIVDQAGHYKVSELLLFFNRLKRCKYGQLYGVVDPMKIMDALAKFDKERTEELNAIKKRVQTKQRQEDEARLEQLKQGYIRRVPKAFTAAAPLSFLQYRLMGYADKTDAEIAAEIAAIQSGEKTIPTDAMEILNIINTTINE